MSERQSARWPALMSEDDAAEYVGVSVAQFRRERDAGTWPQPVPRGCRRNTYSRKSLDDAIDRLASGRKPAPDIDLDRELGLGGSQGALPGNPPPR